MSEYLTTFAAVSAIASAIAAFIAALFGGAIGTFFNKHAERLVEKQTIHIDRQIEEMRAAIAERSAEHGVRFQKLHERRAEAIAETYAACVKAAGALEALTSPIVWVGEPPTEERFKLALEAYNRFSDFELAAPFLPVAALGPLRGIRDEMRSIIIDFAEAFRRTPGDRVDEVGLWVVTWKRAKEQLPKAIGALESALRVELGDPATPETAALPPATLPPTPHAFRVGGAVAEQRAQPTLTPAAPADDDNAPA